MGACFRKGYQSGAWYEIQTVKDVIIAKQKEQLDTSFEEGLLKAWSEYPGYEKAKEALKECQNRLTTRGQSKSRRFR